MYIKSILCFLVVLGSSFVMAQDRIQGYVFDCVEPGVVALTYDDGPGPYTETLLKFLDTAGIPATFFVVGKQAELMPDVLKKTANSKQNHQIALHTFNHADLNSLTAEEQEKEIVDNADIVEEIIGKRPVYMRPPLGNCNEQCGEVMKENGFEVIQWNTDSNDWRYVTSSIEDRINLPFKNIVKAISPKKPAKDNFIVLQHDINDISVALVPKIILEFKKAGFKFTTVANCLGNVVPPYKDLPVKNSKPVEAKSKIAKFAKKIKPAKMQKEAEPKAAEPTQPTATNEQPDKVPNHDEMAFPSMSSTPTPVLNVEANSSAAIIKSQIIALVLSGICGLLYLL